VAANAGFGLDRKRLSEALRKLAGKGLITEGGDDPFIGAPMASRLVRPLPAGGAEERPQTDKRGIDNVAMPPPRALRLIVAMPSGATTALHPSEKKLQIRNGLGRLNPSGMPLALPS
jgi:hypothetical protein